MRGLGFSRSAVEHEASKGRVAKALQKAPRGKHTGLVDQDPGSSPPGYFREFTVIEQAPQFSLVRYRHRQDGKELIEIQPDLEPWLYSAASQAGIKPGAFHLPERHQLLHDNPKVHAQRVTELVKALLAAQCAHLTTLKNWLDDVCR